MLEAMEVVILLMLLLLVVVVGEARILRVQLEIVEELTLDQFSRRATVRQLAVSREFCVVLLVLLRLLIY